MRSAWGRGAWIPLLALVLVGGVAAHGPAGCSALPTVEAVLAFDGMHEPLALAAPRGDPRLFVLERAGVVQIVEDDVERPQPFLDLHTQVFTGGEGGLLGVAFPPDYRTSRRFYLHYTTCDIHGTGGAACTAGGVDGVVRSVIARYTTSADPDLADASSGEVLLSISQPFTNHKGGTIAFGPDGVLYVGLGDGGSGNDPNENAQNPRSLLGKILRIDVSPAVGYAIPASNPYARIASFRGEVWAVGLRNPFRFAFDREMGDLWIGDVGQDKREEVDFQKAGSAGGRNFGWDVMEGTLCNDQDPAPAPPCNWPSFTPPVFEYPHANTPETSPPAGFTGCAIVGGPVYRGVIPELRGLYLFGDYCEGHFYSLAPASRAVDELTFALGAASAFFQLTSFSEDGFGEIYITRRDGKVYRIRSPQRDSDLDGVPDYADNCVDVPNGPLARDAGGNVQLDSDGDGYGNACDPDLDNDGVVNFSDLARMKLHFFSADAASDLDGNGVVNFADLARLKAQMFQPPGPSGLHP